MRRSTQPKIIYEICGKIYVQSGNYVRHVKNVHPEIPGIVEMDFSSGDEMDMDTQDIDDLPPVGTLILVDKTELHEDGPHPVDNDVDIVARPSCQNPYVPFLDEHEFEFAFRLLVKNGIS